MIYRYSPYCRIHMSLRWTSECIKSQTYHLITKYARTHNRCVRDMEKFINMTHLWENFWCLHTFTCTKKGKSIMGKVIGVYQVFLSFLSQYFLRYLPLLFIDQYQIVSCDLNAHTIWIIYLFITLYYRTPSFHYDLLLLANSITFLSYVMPGWMAYTN